jgi:hypothetical protein
LKILYVVLSFVLGWSEFFISLSLGSQKLDFGPTRENLQVFENLPSPELFARFLKVGHLVWIFFIKTLTIIGLLEPSE